MYYVKHKNDRNSANKTKIRIAVIIFALLFVIICISIQFRRVLGQLATIQAQNIYSDCVSNSLAELSLEQSFDIVQLCSAQTGEITSLETNTGQLNLLRSQLSLKMMEKMGQMENKPIFISSGALTGIDLLSGLGPKIEIRLELRGGIRTEITSRITETGINQSLHKISCKVTADYYIILPGYKYEITLTETIPLAESVIVGKVPEAYTYVVGDQSDTIGKIFDYGAGQ